MSLLNEGLPDLNNTPVTLEFLKSLKIGIRNRNYAYAVGLIGKDHVLKLFFINKEQLEQLIKTQQEWERKPGVLYFDTYDLDIPDEENAEYVLSDWDPWDIGANQIIKPFKKRPISVAELLGIMEQLKELGYD